MSKLTLDDVRAAIATLEKVSELYDYDIRHTEWSPDDLRAELIHIGFALDDEELREEIATQVHEVFEAAAIAGTDAHKDIQEVLKQYNISRIDVTSA